MAETGYMNPDPKFVEMFAEIIKQQGMILEIYQRLASPPMFVKTYSYKEYQKMKKEAQ